MLAVSLVRPDEGLAALQLPGRMEHTLCFRLPSESAARRMVTAHLESLPLLRAAGLGPSPVAEHVAELTMRVPAQVYAGFSGVAMTSLFQRAAVAALMSALQE